jgi:hypothetical protein
MVAHQEHWLFHEHQDALDKFKVTLEHPLDGKDKAIGFGQMATYVKKAHDAHGASAAISGLAGEGEAHPRLIRSQGRLWLRAKASETPTGGSYVYEHQETARQRRRLPAGRSLYGMRRWADWSCRCLRGPSQPPPPAPQQSAIAGIISTGYWRAHRKTKRSYQVRCECLLLAQLTLGALNLSPPGASFRAVPFNQFLETLQITLHPPRDHA